MDNDENGRALTMAQVDAGAALARPGQGGSAVAALATEDTLLTQHRSSNSSPPHPQSKHPRRGPALLLDGIPGS
jgi:hypothetical protein